MNRASSTRSFWRILALASAALLCSGSTVDRFRVRAGAGAVVDIPAGWFTMGSNDEDIEYVAALCALDEQLADSCQGEMFRDELPAHRVFVAGFRIDRYEVSNRAYRQCVLSSACSPSRIADTDSRLAGPELPVAGVTWAEADAYCRFRGGSGPTTSPPTPVTATDRSPLRRSANRRCFGS